MKLVQLIKGIVSFNFNEFSKLVIKKSDNSVYLGDLKFNFKGKPYSVLANRCICDISTYYVDIYDLNFVKLISIEKEGVVGASIFSDAIYSIRWEDGNENDYVSIYQNNQELHRYSDFYGFLINEKIRLVYDGFNFSKFKICSLENEDILWSYSLPEGFNIDGKPHLIDNVLFFTGYNEFQKNQLLTGLDIETGAVLWQNHYKITSEHQFIQATAFNEKDQLYYGFYSTYQIFNPKTGELVLEKEIPEIAEHKLEPYVNEIYDDKLWFVSGRGLNKKFGYLNISTQQVELLQDFPQEEDEFFDTPVYHEGKLYLRGKHFNNLYVFE
ncbi:uncharacterized protein CHSO_2001 [Chryseobacterium sp. StRB126]|uniref:hypothetical protein n=1 Tax=Chryseobacterium sp. StRB126 TaxID=878220 RepID=UPI0004E993B2|nr:hypothetical protein [Chryseobacterium sp. StRB126]BAP31038.1 uncharacterized protein CHSO_2001 [Chryseobacterium sp. StRB126]